MSEKDVEIVSTGYRRLEELTQEESKLVSLLISGFTVTDAANLIGISRQTVYNWMNREHVRKEMDRRKQELASQGNSIILKDIESYVNNTKVLAKDNSDKRVMLAANQYLINRIYGNPTSTVIQEENGNGMETGETEIEAAIAKIRIRTKN
ncbi:helix-turn-helix domain-containing protein [Clostridioides sp. ES-S-0145-01]|uniref:helix-turn-helix domain-containing protein n=1 Tax=Clostridioides sp. ES-S-0145-01 TaxID=2770784 RepID=UPI001D0FDB25|nr:helix-turn-helix domain-containing protein [Clostridioides sp. ES-S-0145-01]